MAAVFDINYGSDHEKNGVEHNDDNGGGLEEQQVTKIYGISKIYPDPKDRKGKWYDQEHDLFYTGTQGKTDGYRYNIGKKDNSLDFEMMNLQFAGYFRINKVTHLEDSTYKKEHPEADIHPNAKNRWAMKFGTHASHNDQNAATYEVCGAYLENDVKKYLVGAEAPWKRMWRCNKENRPEALIQLPPLKGKWFGAMIFRWNDKDDKSVHIECWVDLCGLNDYSKPKNKWKKYLEFDDDGKKLESNGEYFRPITKKRKERKLSCYIEDQQCGIRSEIPLCKRDNTNAQTKVGNIKIIIKDDVSTNRIISQN